MLCSGWCKCARRVVLAARSSRSDPMSPNGRIRNFPAVRIESDNRPQVLPRHKWQNIRTQSHEPPRPEKAGFYGARHLIARRESETSSKEIRPKYGGWSLTSHFRHTYSSLRWWEIVICISGIFGLTKEVSRPLGF